ncbi:MAG: glycosyltransferase family 4 protein [Haloferacaceae archaeon]
MDDTELLIVGTLGGGGIHRYVEEQYDKLHTELDAEVYDMYSDSTGQGVRWLLRSLLLSGWAALAFPFRSPPDVVHVHTSHGLSFYRAAVYALFAAHVWRRPLVVHVHGSSFDEFVRTDSRAVRRLQRAVFDASDRIVVLSPYWKRVLSDRTAEEKIRVLPNAVEPERYDPSFDVSPPHVVFVSNMIERKGIRELTAAVDRVADRVETPVRVSIAGSGPLSHLPEDLAARREGVEYLGYVSEAEKRELLGEASIFALPTYAEGLPIAMLEGMAGGNAVVTTAVGSIPEVIGPENGLLVEPGDEEELADALETLVRSPERVESMARRNRTAACETYSWRSVSGDLLDLYAELTPRARSSRPSANSAA